VNAKQGAALAIVILLVVVAVAASADSFLSAQRANDVTYNVPASAVHTSVGETASDGMIALQLNSITNASDPATSRVWIKFNLESQPAGVYNLSLTPPPASQYLVANITVTNVHHATIPFDYGAFALVAGNGTAYYANYAVCNEGCSFQALGTRTLRDTFTNDVYVLFSVPEAMHPTKLVYTASSPQIIISTS